MAIYDVMSMISSPVYTVTMGMAASMGAILFAAGEKGHRYVFEHAKIMIHQPLGGAQGQATDIDIQAKEILRMKETLNRILSEHTGQSIEKVGKDTDRDFFMSADEAKEYGIVDKVVKSMKE